MKVVYLKYHIVKNMVDALCSELSKDSHNKRIMKILGISDKSEIPNSLWSSLRSYRNSGDLVYVSILIIFLRYCIINKDILIMSLSPKLKVRLTEKNELNELKACIKAYKKYEDSKRV